MHCRRRTTDQISGADDLNHEGTGKCGLVVMELGLNRVGSFLTKDHAFPDLL